MKQRKYCKFGGKDGRLLMPFSLQLKTINDDGKIGKLVRSLASHSRCSRRGGRLGKFDMELFPQLKYFRVRGNVGSAIMKALLSQLKRTKESGKEGKVVNWFSQQSNCFRDDGKDGKLESKLALQSRYSNFPKY